MAHTKLGIKYVGKVPRSLKPFFTFHMSGIPKQMKNGFLISFQGGENISPRDTCAFAFNPRFNDNQVIRNSLLGGRWGKEERDGGFPFTMGQKCTITIQVESQHYLVTVDGQHFCEYRHRISPDQVTHVIVEKDFKVERIAFSKADRQQMSDFPKISGIPSINSTTVYNPKVPFVHKLGSMSPRKMFYIGGIPDQGAKRITINFESGNDIAFQFDIRLIYGKDKNVIIRNTMQHGAWGTPETTLQGMFPVRADRFFDMICLVEPSCFKVAVNNQHLLEFMHRIPVQSIDTMRISGDVRLTQKTSSTDTTDSKNTSISTVYNPDVPFAQCLGSMHLRRMFYIGGIPFQTPKRISINLECGDNVAFHLDIRFNYGNDRNAIVRNTMRNGAWGKEERSLQGNFPFQPDKFFDLIIIVEPSCLKVAVNNQHLLEYMHRVPFQLIDKLRISGDVRLTKVRY